MHTNSMLGDLIFLTFRSLRHRPIRSWLTVLGVVIGIMLVVLILVLGNGVQTAIARMMQGFGTDLIVIIPGKETNPLMSLLSGVKFDQKDIEDLAYIDGVETAVPVDQTMLTVEFKGEQKSVLVNAAPVKGMKDVFETSQGFRVQGGRWIENDSVNEVVLGYLAYHELYKEQVRIGDELIIKSKRFKVVGYISEIGSQSDDNQIYIPLPIYQQLTGMRGVMTGFVKVRPGANIPIVVQKVKYELGKQQTVKDFSVLTLEKAGRIVGDILSVVELALVAIALISLVVGAVGIMNTMYTSVLERTKQIGVMKAVGASSDAILSLFLIEAGCIGLIGGLIGAGIGIGLAYLVGLAADAAGFSGVFSLQSVDFLGILSVLIITLLVGILSGVLPARRASKMEPADALRYE